MKYLVGVDEAGRGPLAGPVAVGVAMVPADFDWKLLPGVGDSKKLKPKDREAVYQLASRLKQAGVIDFRVSQTSAAMIDRRGIVPAIKKAMNRCLMGLKLEPGICHILLDGGLKAPPAYPSQETIIKGDSKELVIGLASIVAKVTRDRHMTMLARKYPAYGFEAHKGYGTRLHLELIKEHGISAIHRVSFCRSVRPR